MVILYYPLLVFHCVSLVPSYVLEIEHERNLKLAMAALERQQQHRNPNQNGPFEGWEKPCFLRTNPKLDGVVVIMIKIMREAGVYI